MTDRPPPPQALRLVNGLTNRRETVRVPSGAIAAILREETSNPVLNARIATVAGVLARALTLFIPQARVKQSQDTRGAALVLWVGMQPPDAGLRALWLKVGAVEIAADDAADMEVEADDPALAYAFLGAHYSSPLTLDLESIDAGEAALERLEQRAADLRAKKSSYNPSQVAAYVNTYQIALSDDLNTPTALATVWQMLLLAQDTQINPAGKLAVLGLADKTLALGLDIEETMPVIASRPAPPRAMPQNKPVPKVAPAPPITPGTGGARVTSSREVRSMLGLPDLYAFTIVVVARNSLPTFRACVESVVAAAKDMLRAGESGGGKQGMIEMVLVDLGSRDGSAAYADDLARSNGFVRTVLAERDLGAAAGYNIGFKQSRGHSVVLLDPAYQVTGDIWTPLTATLDDPDVGAVGANGQRITTRDERAGTLATDPTDTDPDGLTADLFAFLRARVEKVGLMDEKFRVARYLDLDYSQNFREAGLSLRVLPILRDTLKRAEGVAAGGRAGLSIGSAGDSADDVGAEARAERERRNARQFLNRA